MQKTQTLFRHVPPFFCESCARKSSSNHTLASWHSECTSSSRAWDCSRDFMPFLCRSSGGILSFIPSRNLDMNLQMHKTTTPQKNWRINAHLCMTRTPLFVSQVNCTREITLVTRACKKHATNMQAKTCCCPNYSWTRSVSQSKPPQSKEVAWHAANVWKIAAPFKCKVQGKRCLQAIWFADYSISGIPHVHTHYKIAMNS